MRIVTYNLGLYICTMKRKLTISDNIRLMREYMGFSQEYIAEKLSITQQAYSQIEKNPEKTTLKRLKDIADILQVNLVTLLGEEETYILQNFNQSGGHAATQMNVTPSNNEREIYERLITELKEEILFLRELTRKN
jgi:transcriptional regulator with XRE-family HTH domain